MACQNAFLWQIFPVASVWPLFVALGTYISPKLDTALLGQVRELLAIAKDL